jgi:predicted dehydrogenase
MKVTKCGVIGCGAISRAYFRGSKIFKNIEIIGCADISPEASKAAEDEWNIPAMTVEELLADDNIEIVINLTVPNAHAQVSKDILNAGKHVHLEKPLAASTNEALPVLELADKKDLRVSCAPDTFLGAGHQTVRKIIDSGWIGKPVAGTAIMLSHGPYRMKNPFFFFQKGAGPMFDIGPYYITALVNLLGPVESVTAKTAQFTDSRTAVGELHYGETIPIDVNMHYTGILEFKSGAIITVVLSWEVVGNDRKPIEIYGTGGSIKAPNPNTFGGEIEVLRSGYNEWHNPGYTHLYHENSRVIGCADLAKAIEEDRPHRTSGELAYHVLEIMESFELSSEKHARVNLKSTCERPEPMAQTQTIGIL